MSLCWAFLLHSEFYLPSAGYHLVTYVFVYAWCVWNFYEILCWGLYFAWGPQQIALSGYFGGVWAVPVNIWGYLQLFTQKLLLVVLGDNKVCWNWTQVGYMQGKHPTHCLSLLSHWWLLLSMCCVPIPRYLVKRVPLGILNPGQHRCPDLWPVSSTPYWALVWLLGWNTFVLKKKEILLFSNGWYINTMVRNGAALCQFG